MDVVHLLFDDLLSVFLCCYWNTFHVLHILTYAPTDGYQEGIGIT